MFSCFPSPSIVDLMAFLKNYGFVGTELAALSQEESEVTRPTTIRPLFLMELTVSTVDQKVLYLFFPGQLLLYFLTTIIIFPDNIYYFFTDKLLFFHRHYLQVVFVPTTRTVRTTLLQVMDDIVVAVRSFHTIDGKMMTLIRLHEGALKK